MIKINISDIRPGDVAEVKKMTLEMVKFLHLYQMILIQYILMRNMLQNHVTKNRLFMD